MQIFRELSFSALQRQSELNFCQAYRRTVTVFSGKGAGQGDSTLANERERGGGVFAKSSELFTSCTPQNCTNLCSKEISLNNEFLN